MAANPIWYVAKGTPAHGVLEASIRAACEEERFDAPIFSLTPYIDFPGRYGNADYHFEWEREWRCVGNVVFKPADVAFLFIAEEDHEHARAFFDDAERENTGPSYRCPFVDPRWDVERMRTTLKALNEAAR